MPRETTHDRIARRVARLYGEYKKEQGPDIVAPELVGEVQVSKAKLAEGIRQLRGYRKPRYLVVPDRLVPAAIERTRGLKVGVMDQHGRIVKRAVQTNRAWPSIQSRTKRSS